jgi:glycosyltransferase involved in cell wall biosynthesis
LSRLISEADSGIFDAMNKGLRFVTGDLVLFLNADDKLATRDALANAVAAIRRDPGADLYYGWLEVRVPGGETVMFRPPGPEDAARFMVCGCLPHQSTLARPSVFEKTGLFNPVYRHNADYDWFLRVLSDKRIKLKSIDVAIGSFLTGGASSQLAQGQPQVYEIQNRAALYASPEWDRLRILEFQSALLHARIENENLRRKLGRAKLTERLARRVRERLQLGRIAQAMGLRGSGRRP